jgi:hypothetical protein
MKMKAVAPYPPEVVPRERRIETMTKQRQRPAVQARRSVRRPKRSMSSTGIAEPTKYVLQSVRVCYGYERGMIHTIEQRHPR